VVKELTKFLPQIVKIHTDYIRATRRNLPADKASLWQKKAKPETESRGIFLIKTSEFELVCAKGVKIDMK
jgi:hypothetical protein